MHPLNKKVKFMKDSIDFGSMEIPKLFRKLLIPTVLGMVFSAVFVITDGIFVGQGIGSDALAAVNITAPLFLISLKSASNLNGNLNCSKELEHYAS